MPVTVLHFPPETDAVVFLLSTGHVRLGEDVAPWP